MERKAQKKLSKTPEPYYSNIKTAILDLGNYPRPKGYKKPNDSVVSPAAVFDSKLLELVEIQD